MSHAARHRQYPPLAGGQSPDARPSAPVGAAGSAPPQGPARAAAAGPPQGPPRAARAASPRGPVPAPGAAPPQGPPRAGGPAPPHGPPRAAGAPTQGPPRAHASQPPTARATGIAPAQLAKTREPDPPARANDFAETGVPGVEPAKSGPSSSVASKAGKASRPRGKPLPQRRAGRSLVRHLLRLGIVYTLYCALWSCSSTPFSFVYNAADERAICRTLATAGDALGPHIGPYAHALDERAAPYVAAVSPFAQAGYRLAAPAVQAIHSTGSQLYLSHVAPVQGRAASAVHSWAAPHVAKAHAVVGPHYKTFSTELGHYNDMYWRDVHPYVASVHAKADAGVRAGGRAYLTHAHPQVVKVFQAIYSVIVNRLFPTVARAYATYVLPHLRTAGTKVWESKSALRTREAIASTHLHALGPAISGGFAKMSDKVATWAQPQNQEPDPAFLESLTTKIRAQILGEQADELARKDAERKEEESTTHDRLNLWEVGLTEHIKKSYKTWTERIVNLRDSTIADLPVRFATLTGDFVDSEAGAAIARLERRFESLSPAKDPRPVEERVEIAKRGLKREQNKLLAEGAQLRKELASVLHELDEAEKASTVKSADDVTQFVEAAVAFQQRLMEQARFPETVTRFGRWDMGMHMRAKLYRAEIEDVLYRGKPVKADMDVVDPNKVAPDVARHVADLEQRTTLLYSAAAEAIRRYGADAIEELHRTPREVTAPDAGVKRHTLALTALKRVADAAAEMQTQIPKALVDAAAAAREKLGWEEILPENPDDDLYNGPPPEIPPEIDTTTRTDAAEEVEQKVAQHEAESVDLEDLDKPGETVVPVDGQDDQVVFHAATTSVAQSLATPTPSKEEGSFHVGTTSVAQPVGTEDAALSASFASQASAAETDAVSSAQAEPTAEPVVAEQVPEPEAPASPVAAQVEPEAEETVPEPEPTEEPAVPGATATPEPSEAVTEPEVEEVLTAAPAVASESVPEPVAAHETATTSSEMVETPTSAPASATSGSTTAASVAPHEDL